MKSQAVWQFPLILAAAITTPVKALETELYGSLRLQAEYVEPDNLSNNFNDYTGLRDAYSRLGLKLSQELSDDWSALFHLELPIDIPNLDIQDPWDQEEPVRILKLQLTGPLGSIWYGQDWMAYYNNIAYPVDYFSSYYSGFATFTSFRLNRTLYYATPSWNGLQVTLASSKDNGRNHNRRNQYTLSYNNQGLTLAAGIDDIGGSGDQKIMGLAASYSSGPWYLAAKYERFDSNISGNGWAADGTDAANALVQYTSGKHTLRAMLADVDNYGESIFHAGWDYQIQDDLKFFVEYYQEQETAAIADSRQTTSGGDNSDPANSGGQAITMGIRFDF